MARARPERPPSPRLRLSGPAGREDSKTAQPPCPPAPPARCLVGLTGELRVLLLPLPYSGFVVGTPQKRCQMEGSEEPRRSPAQDSGERPPAPLGPAPSAGTLWAGLQALLPSTEEGLRLDFGEAVESSVLLLLRQAAGLLYSQGDGLASNPGSSSSSTCLHLSEVILDYSWEKLNIGTWRDVDKEWRRVYAYGCLFKALCLCRAGGAVPEAVRTCDLGLLMGASILDNVLARMISVLQRHLPPPKRLAAGDAREPLLKKTRLGSKYPEVPAVKTEERVLQLCCPSLEHFRDNFLLPQKPVILEGIADHWPCMRKWRTTRGTSPSTSSLTRSRS
ncbi:UNVERIFIED_CONTAM: hypothetical protein K2H54_006184 [Gekko kuhli]